MYIFLPYTVKFSNQSTFCVYKFMIFLFIFFGKCIAYSSVWRNYAMCIEVITVRTARAEQCSVWQR